MKQLYGAGAFTAAYGEVPAPVWVAAITNLTDDECRAGLGRLAKQSREYPANLTQFVEACKPKPVRFLGRPTTPNEMRALEAPRPAREIINKHLASMRRSLGVREKA